MVAPAAAWAKTTTFKGGKSGGFQVSFTVSDGKVKELAFKNVPYTCKDGTSQTFTEVTFKKSAKIGRKHAFSTTRTFDGTSQGLHLHQSFVAAGKA
jgi:hypothetical protein